MDMEREVRNEPALRRLTVDLCRKWRSLLVPQADARGVRYDQCARASDRQEQDKIQDDARLHERRRNDKRALADAASMGRARH